MFLDSSLVKINYMTMTAARGPKHIVIIAKKDSFLANPAYNESTTGADASVEALKLYHMKLTV